MDSGKNGTEGQLNARDIEEMSKRVQEAAETEESLPDGSINLFIYAQSFLSHFRFMQQFSAI